MATETQGRHTADDIHRQAEETAYDVNSPQHRDTDSLGHGTERSLTAHTIHTAVISIGAPKRRGVRRTQEANSYNHASTCLRNKINIRESGKQTAVSIDVHHTFCFHTVVALYDTQGSDTKCSGSQRQQYNLFSNTRRWSSKQVIR